MWKKRGYGGPVDRKLQGTKWAGVAKGFGMTAGLLPKVKDGKGELNLRERARGGEKKKGAKARSRHDRQWGKRGSG